MYNYSVRFKDEFSDEVRKYAEELGISHKFDSIPPHMTIARSEEQIDIPSEDIEVELSGLTLLPSKDGGVWVEISVLKSRELIRLHEQVSPRTVDTFRPHITLGKPESIEHVRTLPYNLLRKRITGQVRYKLI